jgi:Lrp/AsnC family leucine-responsive transcriptional regulator
MTKIALDKTDRKILSILQSDGRLSNQDVAELVALSPSPVCAGSSGWKKRA